MAYTRALTTNILRVGFATESAKAWVRPFSDAEDLQALRRELDPDWSVQVQQHTACFFPIGDHGNAMPGCEQTNLKISENLRLFSRLVNDALRRRFPRYEPIRRKPFVFVGHHDQLLEDIESVLGVTQPLLREFRIWPKYSLDTRLLEFQPDSPFIGVVVDISTRWEVTAQLEDLQVAGIDLTGLFVIRRDPEPDERRLVGRIAWIVGGRVELSESTSDEMSVAAGEVMLEGRREVFSRCLGHLLGSRYQQFESLREKRTGELLGGPPLLERVRTVADVLGQHPLEVAEGLTATVSAPVELRNADDYETIVQARNLDYCFDPARTKRDDLAWRGLVRYGPFSRDTFPHPSPRILVLFPQAAKGATEAFVRQLRDGIPGHRGYEGGLAKTFALVNPRFQLVPVATRGAAADSYRDAITEVLSRGELPDAAIVVMTDRDGDLPPRDNPYLHSKAMLLMAGVPTQHVRLSKITQPASALQYILRDLSIALYAKMKGTPWTVAQDLMIADELVIGVGSAELSESRLDERRRYVGVTTVFRGDGNYLLGQLSREASFDEYPTVLRDSTRSAIEEIKKRNGWQPGDTVRIIIHAARPPRNVDFERLIRDAVLAVGKDQHVEFAFLTVSHEHPFLVFDPAEHGASQNGKGAYAPARGIIVQTERYSRLINTSGTSLVKRAGLPLPRPLQVYLHRYSTFTDLHYLTEQVLKFTTLSWRSTLPATDPVTIFYSELIAGQLARLKQIPDWSPALLNAGLRTSKWFL
jgi:hypothetical protein